MQGWFSPPIWKAALKDADLVIRPWRRIRAEDSILREAEAPLLPEKAILATNSSTLLPSQLAPATGRPDRFLAIHFANEIWSHNTAEIMGHAGLIPPSWKTRSNLQRASA